MANFVTDNYRLDITPQGSYPVVYLSQFENGRQITFRILNKGANFVIPSGISVFASGLKPNGGYYEHVCTIDDTRKYVTMPVEADMTDIKGVRFSSYQIYSQVRCLIDSDLKLIKH